MIIMDDQDDFQTVDVARVERRKKLRKRASAPFTSSSEIKRPKTPTSRQPSRTQSSLARRPDSSNRELLRSPQSFLLQEPTPVAPWADSVAQPVLSQPAACPVCGCRLSEVSHTDTGRAAHVNACLDAAAAAPAAASADAGGAAGGTGEQERLQKEPRPPGDDALGQLHRPAGPGQEEPADFDLQVLCISQTPDAMPSAPAAAAPAPDELRRPQQQQQDQWAQPCLFWDYDDVLAEEEPLWRPSQCQLDADADAQQPQQQQQQQQQDQQQLDQQADPYWQEETNWEEGVQQNLQDDWYALQEDEQQQQQPERHVPPAPQQQPQQTPWPEPRPLQPSSAVNRAASSSSSSSKPQASGIRGTIAGYFTREPRQGHQQQSRPVPQGRENLQQADKALQAKQRWQQLFNKSVPAAAAAAPGRQQRRALAKAQQQQQPLDPAAALANLPLRSPPLPSWWPAWRRLPGTNIVVDAFGDSSKALGGGRSWILTHFHADHYMGLGGRFNQGVVICTPITAALVRLKLRVAPELLLPLPLGQQLELEGGRIELLDANHCPGAAMVVAHPPGGAPPVLHTGDARLTAAATQQQPALQALRGKAVLVLDTTYADPAYCFPPQEEVLDWCLRAVKAELFNPRCLFLFGSYTIGKERLFMHVATALQRKVYVCAAKRSVMAALDLPQQQAALLTTNHLEANIHVVPMRQVSLDAMEGLLQRYKGRYTAVVGFQPTGWTHAGGAGRGGRGGGAAQPSRSSSAVRPSKRLQRGTVVLYQVPYSEHSSCAELREFVEWFRPLRIIPSVNNDKGQKLAAMLEAVTAPPKPVTGPMDAFARPGRQAAAAAAGTS